MGCVGRNLGRERTVSSQFGTAGRASFVVALLAALMFTEKRLPSVLAGSSHDASVPQSVQQKRRLHPLFYDHYHIFIPTASYTYTPTSLSEEVEENDGYYTDDGAITEEMLFQKKDLYEQERDEINNKNNPNEISALENDQPLSSNAGTDDIAYRQWRTEGEIFACAVDTAFMVWLLFW